MKLSSEAASHRSLPTHTWLQLAVPSLRLHTMRPFARLVGRLLLCAVVASGQPATRETQVYPDPDGASPSSFLMLPVFTHSPVPLVPPERTRPLPHRRAIEPDLAALLLPAEEPPDSGTGRTGARAVAVWCDMNAISVRVERSLLGPWSEPSLFQLGSCAASAVSAHFVFFHSRLSDCGGQFKVIGGTLVYTYVLMYTPPAQGQVIRVPPLYLPIHCNYNRFHYSYKVAFRPQVQQATFMKSIRRELAFSLTVYNAHWEQPSSSYSFFLGEQLFFVAKAEALLDGEKIYVDSCYATSSPDPNSMPKMDIVTNHGCMTDSRRENSNSRFLSRGNNWLMFSMDVFLFRTDSQVQYLHCLLSVGWMASHTAKSCNYNKAAGRWEELDASVAVCSCCDSMCGDRWHSVENKVSSQGWVVEQSDEYKPPRWMESIQLEERKEWLEEALLRSKKVGTVHHEGVHASPWETKVDHGNKTNPSDEKQGWRLVTVSQQMKRDQEKSPLTELATRGINTPNWRETAELVAAREKVLDSKTVSVVTLSSEEEIVRHSEHGAASIAFPPRSFSLDLKYNGTDEAISSALTHDPENNPNSDNITCSSVPMAIQLGESDNGTEHHTMNPCVSTKNFTQS